MVVDKLRQQNSRGDISRSPAVFSLVIRCKSGMKCACVHVHVKSERLTACMVANISKIRISVSVLPLVMSIVCVEHKARFQSFPSPSHCVCIAVCVFVAGLSVSICVPVCN